MNLDDLVEIELARINWSEILEADGPASNIPSALRDLLAAKSIPEADKAYWRLENHVVVQGVLFEAALYVVPVLLAALVDEKRVSFVRISIIELLFQILNREPDEEETARGFGDLAEQCREAAREGLWVLYREFLGENRRAAQEVIELIEKDKDRLKCFVESNK